MKKLTFAVILLLAPAMVHAWPWSQDMANQISSKPQEGMDAANPAMRPFPQRSVPVAGTTVQVADLDSARKMANPIPADMASATKGERLYKIYCTPCHGQTGTGDGPVGAKFNVKPANLTLSNEFHTWNPREYSDGYIWGYITFGALMPSYANDMSAEERWHVVNYIRKVLQKGQAAAQAK